MPNKQAEDHICEKVRAAFDEMDKNDDGGVHISEFMEYCKRVKGMEGLCECFNEIDTSDDWCISVEELNDLVHKVPKDKIEKGHVTDLFHDTDTSGNGKLDKNEFRELLIKCGYKGECIQNTIDHVAGDDGQVTLQEFLQHWEHDD